MSLEKSNLCRVEVAPAPTLLRVKDLKVHFKAKKEKKRACLVKAVDGVSFEIKAGETLGVVGESGCGKSSLARALVGLNRPTAGQLIWKPDTVDAKLLHQLKSAQWFETRKDIQMIFQDPLGSLNPRMTIEEIVSEPLKNFHSKLSTQEVRKRVEQMLEQVGLLPNILNRYPHEFSGGQCQRIGIARALISRPKLIICDEPVSALDVSVQAQVINLLRDLQSELGLALIFIAHDLAVVRYISTRIAVMYLGKIVELGQTRLLYHDPIHPYTRALLSAVPVPDPAIERNKKLQLLEGELPSPINPPSGCRFRTRCPIADETCALTMPELTGTIEHAAACLKANLPTLYRLK